MPKIKWSLKRSGPDTWRGTLVLPTGAGFGPGLRVSSKGKTKAQALAQAAGIANQIADNPLLRAALPPGSGPAIKAIGKLASSAAAGKAGSVLKKLTGKGAKRLAKALKFW